MEYFIHSVKKKGACLRPHDKSENYINTRLVIRNKTTTYWQDKYLVYIDTECDWYVMLCHVTLTERVYQWRANYIFLAPLVDTSRLYPNDRYIAEYISGKSTINSSLSRPEPKAAEFRGGKFRKFLLFF